MHGIRAIGVGLAAAASLMTNGCARTCCRPASRPLAWEPVPAAKAPAPSEPQVLVQAAVFVVPDAVLGSVGVPEGTVSTAQREALQSRLAKEPTVKILQMPSLVTLPGQAAALFVVNEHATELGAPSRDGETVGWSGMRWRLTATPSSDRSRVDFDLLLQVRPEPPEGTKVDLAALAASEVRLAHRGSLSKDEAWVLRLPPAVLRPGDPMVVFVQAQVIPPKSP